MLLLNPALSDDLETEMNGWHEPIQSPPPKPSSSGHEIVTIEAVTVLLLGTPCTRPRCWPGASLMPRAVPNCHSTAASCLVSLRCLSAYCSPWSALQPAQGLALLVSVCLFLIPCSREAWYDFPVCLPSYVWIVPATTRVAWERLPSGQNVKSNLPYENKAILLE